MSASARHPYRLTNARQLAVADRPRHIADLVRLVLLTGANERLHRQDFGAGIGARCLFEPLDPALATLIEMRARGSLEDALGDRIELIDVSVAQTDETTLEARVSYRLGGTTDEVRLRLPLANG